MKRFIIILLTLFSAISWSVSQTIVGVWDRKEPIFGSSVSIQFDSDGNYIISQNNTFIILGEYWVSGDTLRYHDTGGPAYCDSTVYAKSLFSISGNQLTITVVNDDCTERNIGLNSVFVNEAVSVKEPEVFHPEKFSLLQNFPNPFNPRTTLQYYLPQAGKISLKIYNLLGNPVATLTDGIQSAGSKSVEWDASDVPSGVYLCRLQAGSFTQTQKLVLMK